MQDQMIIFMALAKGVSRIMTGPLTLHTETAIHIATELTDAKFSVIPLQTNNTCNKNIYPQLMLMLMDMDMFC